AKSRKGAEGILLGRALKNGKRLGGAVARLGHHTAPADVTMEMVAEVLTAKMQEGRPAAAANAFNCLHAAFNYGLKARGAWRAPQAVGRDWGLRANPCAQLQRPPPSNARKRYLQAGELRRFWEWLDGRELFGAGLALKLLILTGQRPHQIVELQRR